MKNFILFFILSFPFTLKAESFISSGLLLPQATSTDTTDSSGQRLAKVENAIGLELNKESTFLKKMTLMRGIFYYKGDGNSQYNYKNTTLTNLSMNYSATGILAVLRFSPISFNRFKVVLGGGLILANQTLNHDRDKLKQAAGESHNIMEHENKFIYGPFLEGGLEFSFNQKRALRFSYRNVQYKSENFATLGGKSLQLSQNQLLIQIIASVN